jgi:hypothetical protein
MTMLLKAQTHFRYVKTAKTLERVQTSLEKFFAAAEADRHAASEAAIMDITADLLSKVGYTPIVQELRRRALEATTAAEAAAVPKRRKAPQPKWLTKEFATA